ncbi:MAG: hypothetical protein V7765_21965, partial [Oleispira sp.]
ESADIVGDEPKLLRDRLDCPVVIGSANAASKLVGTDTGQVPTADDLGVVGETNFTTANYQPEIVTGIGVVRFMKNASGVAITDLQTVPGSALDPYDISVAGVMVGDAAGVVPGTWKNLRGGTVSADVGSLFVRIA